MQSFVLFPEVKDVYEDTSLSYNKLVQSSYQTNGKLL